MAYEDAILTFLSKPENIDVALEIGEYVEKLKPFLLEKFWKMYAETLKSYLTKSEYSDDWEITHNFDSGIIKNYTRCSISPKIARKLDTNLLQACLEHSVISESFRLVLGVRWTIEMSDESNVILAELAPKLPIPGYGKSKWWPAYYRMNYYGYGKNFLVRMGTDSEYLVNEIVDKSWSFFIDLEPTLTRINSKLVQNYLE